jgi:hypothetical protein
MATMSNQIWRYALALESDLERTTRYVEPCEANLATYSIEFARLLLATCAEVEVVARDLCVSVAGQAPAPKRQSNSYPDMNDYRHVLAGEFTKLHTVEMFVPRFFDHPFAPWSSWSGDANPEWWREHQLVKHDRAKNFASATLDRAFQAMAGLLSLGAYLFHEDLFAGRLEMPTIFEFTDHPQTIVNRHPGLPDYARNGGRLR